MKEVRKKRRNEVTDGVMGRYRRGEGKRYVRKVKGSGQEGKVTGRRAEGPG